ncbi:MAG TPA: T9SS type A sorting domain-containing protein [Bacteroidetes bacterium]|nr:T9SS type A sorting domain-containing protein [Bacteroidota bacterium]HEX04476.1 T9SS type A sorting domain-containing protein [Bacteroidota bacterium]
MFGFQIDDIVITADAATVWADDADGGNIGGPPSFITGADAAGLPVLPFQVEIADVGIWGPAPSPTNVAGVFADIDQPFSHYLEGPEFDLADLDPGESYWLDLMFNSDIEYTNDFPREFVWRPEVWNPVTNGWVAVSTTGNYVYVGGNGSIWEPFSTSGFTYDWDMSEYAGMEGVRLRIYFSAPSEPRTMTHHLIDDMIVDKLSLQHDISTMLNMPYPTSVGTDVYGKVILTNNSPNDETGFSAVWDLGGMIFPLLPAAPYSLAAGDSLELSINDPTDLEHVGYWVPDVVGVMPVNAYHTMGSDEIPENDNYPVTVDVLAAGQNEIGTDSRNYSSGLLSAGHAQDEGPIVHINPQAVNPYFFPPGTTFDFSELRMYAFFHSAAGGAPPNCTMDFIVYDGGDTPGAVLHTGTYSFTEAPGYTGDVLAVLDVSGVAALQGFGGDFWLEARLTTPGTGGYMQPFPYQTAANDYLDTQFYTYDNAVAGTPLTTYGHHVTAVVTNLLDVEDVTGSYLPSEFAMGSAYPNPFNPSTTISFNVAQPGNVALIVYNVMGQEVARVVDRDFQAGSYNANFNAAALSSGVYFVRMEATGFNATQKIMLMK